MGKEEAGGDSNDTEPIPQRQVDVARRAGWSDDEIVKVSEETPHILESMVALADRVISQPQVETKVEPAPKEKQVAQEEKELKKIELTDEVVAEMKESYGDKAVTQAILPLIEGLNSANDAIEALRGSVTGVEKTNQATQFKKNFDEANAVFDGLTETFTVFGKTDELPKLTDGKYDVSSPAVKERSEVFKVANAFQASGMSWTDSLKNAVDEAFTYDNTV